MIDGDVTERSAQRVRSSDGTLLNTEVFLPQGRGPFPAMLLRTPYGIADRVEDAVRMCGDGVGIVIQDCRGRFGSGGQFDLGAHDRGDGVETVAWIREQPWSDGRIATWGFSYGGHTQWQTLTGAPEGLVCGAPIMAPPPWSSLDFRRGGAIELSAAAHWLPRQAATDPGPWPDDIRLRCLERAFETEHVVTQALGFDAVDVDRALAHPALTTAPVAAGWPVEGVEPFEQLWREVFALPRAGLSPRSPVQVPLLVLGSWWDLWSSGTVDAWRWARATSPPHVARHHRLIMTAAGHGFDPVRHGDVAGALRFGLDVDHQWALEWLLDRKTDLRDLSPVTWLAYGGEGWRSSSDWPPPGAETITLHLSSGGALTVGMPATGELPLRCDPNAPVPTRGGAGLGLVPGPSDQRGLSGAERDDVLSFVSEPLPRQELAGRITARLFVSSDAPDLDACVKIVDVAPDGTAVSVADGISRSRWRNGDSEPSFLEDGSIVELSVEVGDVGYVVEDGHRLRVDLAGTNFPRFDRNTHTRASEGTTAGRFPVATHRIHVGRRWPSSVSFITLPEDQ